MRKPVATLPSVEEMPNEPRMPRQTGRYRNTPIGGKMGSADDDMGGGAQINPTATDKQMSQGHTPTAITSEHMFGQRHPGGSANGDGYKMHMNPHDVSRSQDLQGDVKVPKIKIPKQPRLKTPKV